MKKKRLDDFPYGRGISKILRVMKLVSFLILTGFLQVMASNVNSQNANIKLSMQDVALSDVIKALQTQTEFTFFYSPEDIKEVIVSKVELENATIQQTLDLCLKGTNLDYEIVHKSIILKKGQETILESLAIPAQQQLGKKEVSGVVKDAKGLPLPGVSVFVKGTTTGTATDIDGKFKLTVLTDAKILAFSFIGMKGQEVAITGKESINVVLQEQIVGLSEIVSVGYGTSRKKDITGSVASVSLNEQEKTPVIGTEQLLEGRVAGVQVTQQQSQPGAAFSIRIRGTNSINSSSAPLFVVDGYADADPSYINPSDVLSMDVLKDASATAIYGSRGANGVIIITTKRGSGTGSKVTVEGYTGLQQVAKQYNMMDATQYSAFANRVVQENNGLFGSSDPLPFTTAQIGNMSKGTNWQNEIFRTAPISNVSVSLKGGNADSKHYLSVNLFDQKGIILGSDYTRGSLRYNLDQNIGSKIKVGVSSQTGYSYQNATTVNTPGGANSPSVLWDAVRFNPMFPVKDVLGNYTYVNGPAGVGNPLGNPIAYVNEAKDGHYNLSAMVNTFAEYQIIKDLKFKTSFGVSYANSGSEQFVPTTIFASSGIGSASQSSARSYNWLSENTLTYDKVFAGIHSINAMAGFTYQHWYNKSFYAGITNLSTDKLGPWNFGIGQPQLPTSYFGENVLASYFGRINYRLMDKYLLTVTMRADGSSRFGENSKWGYFPSAAFAWQLGQEEFIKNIKAISNLKLRVSYGVTGNQEIGSYNSLSRYSSDGIKYSLGQTPSVALGMIPLNIANSDLKWESTSSSDVGLDLGLWNNGLTITADYYYKKTSDMLLWVNLPLTSGYQNILKNAGSLSNEGFEISVTTKNFDHDKFKWNTTVNFSTNANKVLELGGNKQMYVGQLSGSVFNGNPPTSSILVPGKAIGSFYGYIFDGIWQSREQINNSGTKQAVNPGDPIYKDLNHDGIINGDDRAIIGQALPKFMYGITNNFTFGRFNLNVFIQGVYGNKIINENLYEIENGNPNFNKLAYVGTDSWNGPGTSNSLPRVSSILRNATGLTSDVLQDGSFVRLKSVNLTYILPPPEKSSVFKSVSIYVTAQNLLTLTHYKGYDPEVNSFTDGKDPLSLGTDYNAYPNYRTFLVGVKFDF